MQKEQYILKESCAIEDGQWSSDGLETFNDGIHMLKNHHLILSLKEIHQDFSISWQVVWLHRRFFNSRLKQIIKSKNKKKKEGKFGFEINGRKEREMNVSYSDDVTVTPRDLFTAGEEVSDGFEEASELGVH